MLFCCCCCCCLASHMHRGHYNSSIDWFRECISNRSATIRYCSIQATLMFINWTDMVIFIWNVSKEEEEEWKKRLWIRATTKMWGLDNLEGNSNWFLMLFDYGFLFSCCWWTFSIGYNVIICYQIKLNRFNAAFPLFDISDHFFVSTTTKNAVLTVWIWFYFNVIVSNYNQQVLTEIIAYRNLSHCHKSTKW